MELQLFPPEDTTIVCKTPDGSTIEVDAMDLDDLIVETYANYGSDTIPRTEYLKLICEQFHKKYNYKMSKRSMDMLLEAKTRLLDKIKKNTYLQSDPVDSMESSQETTES